jgi:hypothetical protein
MARFAIVARFPGDDHEVSLLYTDADNAEQALLGYLLNSIQSHRPELVVPAQIAASNGTSRYVHHGTVFRAVPAPESERRY